MVTALTAAMIQKPTRYLFYSLHKFFLAYRRNAVPKSELFFYDIYQSLITDKKNKNTNVRTSIMCIRVGRRIRIVKHDNHCNCPINYIKLRGLDEYKAFEFHFIKKEQGEYKWQH